VEKINKANLLSARDVKSRVAVLFVALNARAHVALAANVALETPAGPIDILNANDGLEEDGVGEVDLGYPNGADDVRPLALVGLLERAVLVRTEDAGDGRRGRLYALAA
jgi:hypothetical protein